MQDDQSPRNKTNPLSLNIVTYHLITGHQVRIDLFSQTNAVLRLGLMMVPLNVQRLQADGRRTLPVSVVG